MLIILVKHFSAIMFLLALFDNAILERATATQQVMGCF
jgi:hypothetical protein